jgi:hypothetical protein
VSAASDTPSAPATTVAELLEALDRRPALAIDAELTVSADGAPLSVVGYDDLVAVDLPSFAAAIALWRRVGSASMDAAAALASVGLTAEVRVRGVPVARLGDDAEPSSLAQSLGLGPVELIPEGSLLAASRVFA